MLAGHLMRFVKDRMSAVAVLDIYFYMVLFKRKIRIYCPCLKERKNRFLFKICLL